MYKLVFTFFKHLLSTSTPYALYTPLCIPQTSTLYSLLLHPYELTPFLRSNESRRGRNLHTRNVSFFHFIESAMGFKKLAFE